MSETVRQKGFRLDYAAVSLFLLAFVYWLSCHRYTGIWHDAIIYNLLAAHYLDPAAYRNDLFFAFGSQDSFSIFTPIFSSLVKLLGMDMANRLVVFAGGMLWVFSLVRLVRGMFEAAIPVTVAVLACVVSLASYSPNFNTFTLNENFATARLIAMSVGVLALAAGDAGRWRWGGLLALIATALHPLLGIWPLLTLVAQRLSDRRLLACGVFLLLLFVIGVGAGWPSSLRVMDIQWAGEVSRSSRDVFLGGWGTLALNHILFWIAALWLGGRLGTIRFRRLYQIVALFSVWAVLLSQTCSYWLPVHLVMEVQPWRVLWLAVVLGIIALVDAGWNVLSKNSDNWYWGLPMAVAMSVFRELDVHMLVLLVVLEACGALPLVARRLAERRKLAAVITALLVLAMLPTWLLMTKSDGISFAFPALDTYPMIKGIVLGGGGFTFLFWGLVADTRRGRQVFALVAIPFFAYASLTWDARSDVMRQREQEFVVGGNVSHPFKKLVKAGDVIAFAGDPLEIWFRLGAACYSNRKQATGIVFSRDKAIESYRRQSRLAVAVEIKEGEVEEAAWNRVLRNMNKLEQDKGNIRNLGNKDFTPAGIRYLCADPVLSWVVLGHRLKADAEFTSIASDHSGNVASYLYDCKSLRNNKL